MSDERLLRRSSDRSSLIPISECEDFSMTTLSVVIPAYNEEDGIAAIVDRVLATEPALRAAGVDALECVVVDDGSSDRTAEIVEGYVGSGVRLIASKIVAMAVRLKLAFRPRAAN